MTSALHGERLDFLLSRLAKNGPLPLDLDQKKTSLSGPVSTKKVIGSQANVGSRSNARPSVSDARTPWSAT